MSTVFLIGNGLSRKSINLKNLNGITYGCNALYRDFMPDHLVVADKKMLDEVIKDFKNTTFFKNIYTQDGYVKRYKKKGITFQTCPESPFDGAVDSGYCAFKLALHQKKGSTIYFLGYDYITETPDATINNIYAGTPGYPSDFLLIRMKSYLIEHIARYCKQYKNIQFVRVVEPGISFIWLDSERNKFKKIERVPNYKEITVEEFKKINEN